MWIDTRKFTTKISCRILNNYCDVFYPSLLLHTCYMLYASIQIPTVNLINKITVLKNYELSYSAKGDFNPLMHCKIHEIGQCNDEQENILRNQYIRYVMFTE